MTRIDAERQKAIDDLKGWIHLGDTVYTILDSVSRSGMSRVVRVLLPIARPAESSIHLPEDWRTEIDFIHPNYSVGKAIGLRHAKRNGYTQDGLVIGGCGTDVGFEIVYNVGRALWPDGYGCHGENCHSNDHSNGDRNREPHTADRPHWHQDGGYALRQRWL